MQVVRRQSFGFEYGGILFEEGFRADLVVDNRVIVELKSLDRVAPVHRKQLLTYLRLAHMRVGLLISFGARRSRKVCILSSATSRRPHRRASA